MNRREAVDKMVDELGVPGASVACKVAAVLFSYRCSIACKHCCFGCAQDRPEVAMTPQQCVDALALLHETGRVVHIAGGEAMIYWGRLVEAITTAHERGIAPHFLETNCSFAVNDELVRERFRFLAAHGVRGMYASADPYHQEFVPAERFLRVRRITKEIFGERNFYGPGGSDEDVYDFERIARDELRLHDFVRKHPPIMVGTAQQKLARHLDNFPSDDPATLPRGWGGSTEDGTCASQFRADSIWELHIDPYGNVQTNCGMILGVVPAVTPALLLASGPDKANRFVQRVCEAGPRGLARLAADEYGFVAPERVTQGCDLCYVTRKFLRRHHPDVFGPAEIYG